MVLTCVRTWLSPSQLSCLSTACEVKTRWLQYLSVPDLSSQLSFLYIYSRVKGGGFRTCLYLVVPLSLHNEKRG